MTAIDSDSTRDDGSVSNEEFADGAAYEPYVGRWSRMVARGFLAWLTVPPVKDWLDIGCGTGALSASIAADANPRSVTGIDPSPGFVNYARALVCDPIVRFEVGDARSLPFPAGKFDAVVGGLMLNFVPNPAEAVAEMVRVAKRGGVVAAYVWDYADQMQFMRYFWDAASELDPSAIELDEGRRFSFCQPGPLGALFSDTGLNDVSTHAIDVPTTFTDFDDFWLPFLGGQGPAPGYLKRLDPEDQTALQERIRANLPTQPDGTIHLMARAWAVRGRR